ncbi:MAG: D-tyrosyl-tRNA(Tyr) deacylase [Caldisericia bacterium]|nr:D-tyrosyl-tRNA(Tyr) deacylase [Caldisericia bacterium]
MIFVLQRVNSASVSVSNETIASISKGILVYVGVVRDDSEDDAKILAKKIDGIRIFENDERKMTFKAHKDYEFLLISQFTLCSNLQKGFRPDFSQAEKPDQALKLFNSLCRNLKDNYGRRVKTGLFGADMQVYSQIDGPVTIYFNSRGKN